MRSGVVVVGTALVAAVPCSPRRPGSPSALPSQPLSGSAWAPPASRRTTSTAASAHPALNGRGGVIAFDSIATNLVDSDTNGDADVFVRDRAAGETTRISVSTRGRQGDGNSQRPDVSGDGRWVVFDSTAKDLVPGTDTNGVLDVFVRDRATGPTQPTW